MSDLVYPPVIAGVKAMFRLLDLRIRTEGTEHVPTDGGAVLASNHISYLDFAFCGLAAQPSGRLVRFMAKQEIFAHRVGGPLMRGMKHISVDRDFGLSSYRSALARLKAGEVIGIFPEGTISTSFEVAELKPGAVRLAAAADVPVIPMAVWGGQQIWTKGRPRRLTQRHVPISIIVGEPLRPGRRDDPVASAALLRERICALVERARLGYPDRPAAPAQGTSAQGTSAQVTPAPGGPA